LNLTAQTLVCTEVIPIGQRHDPFCGLASWRSGACRKQ
jgi:hypothetical protein